MGKWTLAIGGVTVFLGMLLGQFIKVFIGRDDAFAIEALLGVLPVSLILIVINIIQVKRKKDNTPEMDERTVKNILKFQTLAAQIFIGLLFVSLIIITFLNVESVSISILWIIILIYMCLYGIGTLVVKGK